jgi:IgA peptidase M64/peptidase M64-like protein
VPKYSSLPWVLLFSLQITAIAHADDLVAQPVYGEHFNNEALRIDLVHSGTRGQEFFGLDELIVEPIWPGTRTQLIDQTGYGKYRFRVFDKATKKEIFSKGYCTLFGEWTTTEEAGSGTYRSMTEPLRFPLPKAPVTLAIEVRDDKTGAFAEIQRLEIDATAYDLRREQVFDFEVVTLHDSGRNPQTAVDVVIIPDGYTTDEEYKMMADAKRFGQAFMEHSPFDRHADKITMRLVKAFSRESGPDEPRKAIFHDTIVDTTFDTFHSPRYLTTSNMKRLRQVAALAPYDTIVVMVNSSRYGGGGIFGSYSIFTSDSEYDEYVLIHEFGHGFGALADEYYSSATGYDEDAFYAKGVEPWEPNITAQTERDKVKWKEHLTPDVPIPTPDTDEFNDVIGVFEGAGYKAKGLYRGTRDSKMFHKGLLPFGPINEAAIETMIRYYTEAEVSK